MGKKGCCRTCNHFQKDSGECWANPPTVQMGMAPNMLTGKVEPCKWTVFPQPKKEMIDKIICGSYSPLLEVAQ